MMIFKTNSGVSCLWGSGGRRLWIESSDGGAHLGQIVVGLEHGYARLGSHALGNEVNALLERQIGDGHFVLEQELLAVAGRLHLQRAVVDELGERAYVVAGL